MEDVGCGRGTNCRNRLSAHRQQVIKPRGTHPWRAENLTLDDSYKRKNSILTFVRNMKPKISAAEWEVMNVVWVQHPITAAQVYAGLPEGNGWKQKTVNTFLTRLVAKKVLGVTKQGNLNLYAPRLRREECVATEGDSFLSKVFQGAAGSLVLHFCERAELSPEEIRKLEQMLKAKKGRG